MGLHSAGGGAMAWETPSFTDIKMDAELAAYFDDLDAG